MLCGGIAACMGAGIWTGSGAKWAGGGRGMGDMGIFPDAEPEIKMSIHMQYSWVITLAFATKPNWHKVSFKAK